MFPVLFTVLLLSKRVILIVLCNHRLPGERLRPIHEHALALPRQLRATPSLRASSGTNRPGVRLLRLRWLCLLLRPDDSLPPAGDQGHEPLRH